MALVPPLDATPEEIRQMLAPLRSRATIALFAAENAFAVGAVIRVAHSFLFRDVVIVGSEPHYEKASMGMDKLEVVRRIPDEAAFLAWLGERPLWAVEKDHATTSLYDVASFPDDVVLLFGSERGGIPDSLVSRAAVVVGIPIYGVNHSLPLAVAAGIVMSEHARRRFRGGAVV